MQEPLLEPVQLVERTLLARTEAEVHTARTEAVGPVRTVAVVAAAAVVRTGRSLAAAEHTAAVAAFGTTPVVAFAFDRLGHSNQPEPRQ